MNGVLNDFLLLFVVSLPLNLLTVFGRRVAWSNRNYRVVIAVAWCATIAVVVRWIFPRFQSASLGGIHALR